MDLNGKLNNMRTKTISKYFYDDEIKGVIQEGDQKIIYLKTGVKRLRFNDDLGNGEYFEQLNQELIANDRRQEAMKLLYGGDDFEEGPNKFEN